jgi:4-hydroxy-tetrahydrodipicolinate reductase
MTIRIILAGATGWVGRELTPAIARSGDLALVGAVARSAAGRDVGEATGVGRLGVRVSGSLTEAMATPADVLIDYTGPDVVKHHVLQALAHGLHVVIGTSGLGADDFAKIDTAARVRGCGVIAAGNFSITATLLKLFALEAARHIADVEIIDYATAKKSDTPSGTARELAEALAAKRQPATSRPVDQLVGIRETRGGAVGVERPVHVHSLRIPSYVLSCEAVFGAPDERLTIRHDAGSSAAPYVAGTLLAARRVGEAVGLRRGLETLLAAEKRTAGGLNGIGS